MHMSLLYCRACYSLKSCLHTDVSLVEPATLQILVYNADVSLVEPATLQILVYNADGSLAEPATLQNLVYCTIQTSLL